MTTLALILGSNKTGSTTAAAICNADPLSHFLYDVDFSLPSDNGRNSELTAAFPGVENLFGSTRSLREPLARFLDLARQIHDGPLNVFGMKTVNINEDYFVQNADLPIIFTFRDVKTWLCKGLIIQQFLDMDYDRNVVPLAIANARILIASFKHERVLRLRLEDIGLEGGKYWPTLISRFLPIDFQATESWWLKREMIQAKTASYSNWASYHDSAFVEPRILDTKSKIKPHKFWDALLPIFEKYYQKPNGSFSTQEINTDLRELDLMTETFSMTLREGFEAFETFKIKEIVRSSAGKEHLSTHMYLKKAF